MFHFLIEKTNTMLFEITFVYILTEQKIAFTAGIPNSRTFNSREILNFTKVITNEGEGLNVSDGVFYCPEQGLYYVFVNNMVSSTTASVANDKNNNKIMRAYTNPGTSNWNVGSYAVIIILDKSDKLFVMSDGLYWFYYEVTFFTGFKI